MKTLICMMVVLGCLGHSAESMWRAKAHEVKEGEGSRTSERRFGIYNGSRVERGMTEENVSPETQFSGIHSPTAVIPEARSAIRDPIIPPRSLWQSTKDYGWTVLKILTAGLAVTSGFKVAHAQQHIWDNTTTACAPHNFALNQTCLDGAPPQVYGQLLCDHVLVGRCPTPGDLGIFTDASWLSPSCFINETLSLGAGESEDQIALYCNENRQSAAPCLNSTFIESPMEINVALKNGRQVLQCLFGNQTVEGPFLPATLSCHGDGVFSCATHQATYQIFHTCPGVGGLCRTPASSPSFNGRFNGTCACIPAAWDFSSPCAPTVIPDDPRADPGSITTTSIPLDALCRDGSLPTLHGQLLCDGVPSGTCPTPGDFGVFTPDNVTPRTFCTADETASIGWGTYSNQIALYCTNQNGVTTRIINTECLRIRDALYSPYLAAHLMHFPTGTSLACDNNNAKICNDHTCTDRPFFSSNTRTYCRLDEIAKINNANDYGSMLVCINKNSGHISLLYSTQCATCCRYANITGSNMWFLQPRLLSVGDKTYLSCDVDDHSDLFQPSLSSVFQKNLPIMAVPQPILLSCVEGSDVWCPYDAISKTYRIVQKCSGTTC